MLRRETVGSAHGGPFAAMFAVPTRQGFRAYGLAEPRMDEPPGFCPREGDAYLFERPAQGAFPLPLVDIRYAEPR